MNPGTAVRTDVRTALKEGIARLRAARVPSDTLAAEILLMHTLGRDRTWLYTHPEEKIDAAAAKHFFELVARRAAGEPTQYLTGKQEFWGMEFEVTPAVLIPRPETEHVVEVALERLGARGIKIKMNTGEPSKPLLVADVGTGSGCLAVALARELPHANIVATDISTAALEVAGRNAARHAVSDQIELLKTDLLADIDQESPQFDLIVSNPPYISEEDKKTLQREVREHEPPCALFCGVGGMEIYERLIEQAANRLRPGGILVMELGYDSLAAVRGMMEQSRVWREIRVTNDLAAIPRVISTLRAS